MVPYVTNMGQTETDKSTWPCLVKKDPVSLVPDGSVTCVTGSMEICDKYLRAVQYIMRI